MLKILQAMLQQFMNHEHPDVQAGFRKHRRTRDQIPDVRWIIKKVRDFQKSIYFWFIDYTEAFDYVDHKKLWEILQDMEIQTTWPAFWEICMQVKMQQLELDMEQQTGSKSGKMYIKAVYSHPAYLTYMQITSCKMMSCMKHKLESKFPGEISITSDTYIYVYIYICICIPRSWQKVKN